MQGNWIKIVLFVLGAFMLAGITQVLLDPGLGKPDEARRTRHPAGFSFIPPRGWGASVFYGSDNDVEDQLRVSPERSTGRQPTIGVIRNRETVFAPDPTSTPYTFQGQPAVKRIVRSRNAWIWRIDFTRDGVWYAIGVTYPPVPQDVEGGPLWPFLESFRVEKPLNLSATSLPSTLPTTSPVP